jgi:uncharacterized protein (TIRG00374 family)
LSQKKEIKVQFSLSKILLPVVIGLTASAILLYFNLTEVRFEFVGEGKGDFTWIGEENGLEFVNPNAEEDFIPIENGDYTKRTYSDILAEIDWTWQSTFWLFLALIGMVIRDLAYMMRIRYLTDGFLSWRKSFDVIMLWEFASAVTPSVVGGSGVAVYILNREKIPLGKSTAIVMITAMFDEIFYLTMVPLVILTIGRSYFFPDNMSMEFLGSTFNVEYIFWIGFAVILAMTLFIAFGILYKPQGTRRLLAILFSLPVLRKWKFGALRTGNEIVTTSNEMKGRNFMYWFKPLMATYFSWTFRYLVVNFLILAFTSTSLLENGIIYARQLGMWVITLISPTPGGSGIAELAFNTFLKDFIPFGLAATLAILWRIISYYPYLFIGSLVLPNWIKRTGSK